MKILIVKLSALGDVIHAFPAIAYLRATYPDALIDWVVEKGASMLVEAHPDIRKVIVVDTKTFRRTWKAAALALPEVQHEMYDLCIDLQGNTKSALFTFWARAREKIGYGFKTAPEWLNPLVTHHRVNPPKGHNIRDDLVYIASQGKMHTFTPPPLLLKGHEPVLADHGPKILVAPGSQWTNKCLELSTLIPFLKEIEGYFYLTWGSPQERDLVAKIQAELPERSEIVERLSLPNLQRLMSKMDQVIAMDSLPLHLGATTGVPTFSIFGPSLAHKYKPVGPLHVAYQGSCPYGRTFEKRCPILRTCSTGACMRALTAEQLKKSWTQKKL